MSRMYSESDIPRKKELPFRSYVYINKYNEHVDNSEALSCQYNNILILISN